MENLSVIGSFAGVMLLVPLISWYFTRKDNLRTEEGYFLAGRNLGAFVIASSLLLSNLSTEHLIGLNGSAYKHGIAVMAWENLAAIACVLMALFFLPKYLKMGLVTITQFLELRFDKQTRIICSGLFLGLYFVALLPIVLYTGAINLESIFDFSQHFNLTQFQGTVIMVVVIGLIGASYAIFGGLKGVAVSDTVNGLLLLSGGLLIPVIALYKIGSGSVWGGFQSVYHALPEHFNAIGSEKNDVPFSTIFTGMMIPQIFYWTMNQFIIQRTLGARNLAEGQKGVLLAGLFKILVPLIIVLPGIIACYYFNYYQPKSIPNSDYAYPELVKAVLPAVFTGFFAAVMIGAVLSTFNSALNSASTLFSMDIYKEYINKNAGEKQVVASGKICAAILAVVVILTAPLISKAGSGLFNVLQELNVIFNMPIFTIVLSGLLLKKVSAKAAKICLIAGAVFFLIFKFGATAMGLEIHFLHRLAIAFVLTLSLLLLLSKIYPRKNQFVLTDTGVVNVENWKYVKIASALIVFLVVSGFIAFSAIGFLK